MNILKGYTTVEIILIAGLAIVVAGVAFYSLYSNDQLFFFNQTIDGEQTTTLRNLLMKEKDEQCTFFHADGTTTEGTIYIAGTDMRGDFMTRTENNNSVGTHMIKTSTNIFVWSDSVPRQGIKLNIANEINDLLSKNGVVNLDEELKYICSGWNKDVNKFVVPSAINFIDINNVLKE